MIRRLFGWLQRLQKESVQFLRAVIGGPACVQQIFYVTLGKGPFYLFISRYHKTGLVG